MISRNIMSLGEGRHGSVYYEAICSCGSSDCELLINLETNEHILMNEKGGTFKADLPADLTLNIYGKINDYDRGYDSFWGKLKWRIKKSFQILFTGYVEGDKEFVFNGREAIKDFIRALEEGMRKVEKPFLL